MGLSLLPTMPHIHLTEKFCYRYLSRPRFLRQIPISNLEVKAEIRHQSYLVVLEIDFWVEQMLNLEFGSVLDRSVFLCFAPLLKFQYLRIDTLLSYPLSY